MKLKLEKEIESVLKDVAASVNDWKAMSDKLKQTIEELPKRHFPGSQQELQEATEFLTYLNNHHFTLLGYRQYDLKKVKGDLELLPNMETGLGLMNRSEQSQPKDALLLSTLSETARKQALDQKLILTKGRTKSRVHRPAYVDYIGIKRFDKKGQVIGEDRFLGLYASNLYNRSPRKFVTVSKSRSSIGIIGTCASFPRL